MRNRIIFAIFAISLLAFVFYFCFEPLFLLKADSDVVSAETSKPLSKKGLLESEPEKIETILLAVGDIMLSRHVGTKIRQAQDNILPFQKLKDELSQADITFGNLESPFYDKGHPVTAGMVFKAEPETIEGLFAAGFDILSLANNHFGDQGRAGMEYTFSWLDKHGIKYTGAGRNITKARSPAILENNGIKFTFLGYCQLNCSAYQATKNKAGFACLDIGQMKEDVSQAQKEADIVIVSMHAGTEYTNQPTQKQKDFARTACDSGASLVLGHHPHVVQITEQYNDCYIIYSLGNFVFDQMWSQETREGTMAKCKFEDKELKEIEFISIKIENYNQPRLAKESESKQILERMGLEEPKVEFEL